ncbi:PE-PGRS family protein PE_PGRS16-like [Penaeus japonicus]|uniref:PE-PGRS family protein PE_PGRS16-like n=1 Tax=Penaeus japonicus TaxID=27405 RepID=UPI001C70F599|nr:PE-PGRS family protein PE_PGRS16-like [Penaeus japonicus]
MKLLIILLFTTAAFAQPQGYGLPTASENGLFSGAGGFSSGAETLGGNGFSSGVAGLASAHESSAGAGYDGGSGGPSGACREGEIIHVDGSCVVPVITRNVYVFDAPERPQQPAGPPPSVPPPKIDHNIVFVRLPEAGPGLTIIALLLLLGGIAGVPTDGGIGSSGVSGFGDGGIGSSGVSGFGGDGGFGGSGLIDLRRGNGGIDLSGAGGNGARDPVVTCCFQYCVPPSSSVYLIREELHSSNEAKGTVRAHTMLLEAQPSMTVPPTQNQNYEP